MFLILALALLPLGLVALVASLQAIRTADAERISLLRIEATQSARKLASEIAADSTALSIGTNALADGTADAKQCSRIDAFMRKRASDKARFSIYDKSGRRICATPGKPAFRISQTHLVSRPTIELLPRQGLLLVRTFSRDNRLVALISYQRERLMAMTDPATAMANHHIILTQGKNIFPLDPRPLLANGGTIERVSASVERTNLGLTVAARQPPQTLVRTMSLFLPLVMWFAAAGIGWFVVNRLLIQPLVMLRRAVAAYQPGIVLRPLEKIQTPAQEIVDLGETFRAISEDVATHEAEMADSLVKQRKLTREVHHRVKNNLQIIASLINLHSRSAATPEASEAYGTIQRRVDALSVVHRNHYAELEENRGVGIRPLVSELSASLRASAPDTAKRLNIQIDSADLHVSQDVAVPVAFLTTELVELAMLCEPNATVRISITPAKDQVHKAELRVVSSALRTTPALEARLDGRFDRVLTGLSRQLRAPLHRNEEDGVFCIEISVLE
ncbi:MAG: sensor histidine kinase [Sphingobium sp.]